MRKQIILTFFVYLFSFTLHAQVDNYCIRLASGGQVDCGPMPELDEASSYSLQWWMNADAWTPGATLFQRGSDFSVVLGENKRVLFNIGGKQVTAASNNLVTGQWVQVTAVITNGSAALYVNGSRSGSGKLSPISTSKASFIIGGGSYEGRIDEVRIWNNVLSTDYDRFIHNTLNKWVPQLDDLVAYYKFDQNLCPDIVDYKALFAPSEYNHHGTLSDGAQREQVTDNSGLPYLLCGAYTNNNRFYDRAVDRDKYLLANDLIILGLNCFNDGHVKVKTPNNHATLVEADYLESFEGRSGVIRFNGEGSYLECTKETLAPDINDNGIAATGYTFETWLYLDEWTEGAYLFRKESGDGQKGFSIRLGSEEKKQVIVRVNGKQYVNINKMPVGEWVHFAVTPFAGGTTRLTFLFSFNGTEAWSNASASDSSTDYTPTGMENYVATIGEGLKGKMDETAIWNLKFSLDQIKSHMAELPMPAIGKSITADPMLKVSSLYLYDKADRPGYDSYSQDEWLAIMKSAYQGYRGYQIRISVDGDTNKGWQTTIANANLRKVFAADIARLSEPYDGVELDLEWMDGTQTNLGLLCDEILAVLPKGKTLMVSAHQYGAYKYPKEKIQTIDGFTFQQYGPQNNWFSYSSFVNGAQAFQNYGFPNNKMYLSYSTTTSGGFLNGTQKAAITGVRKGFFDNGYVPDAAGNYETMEYNGYTYYFMGPTQVYLRAKYVVDNNMQGIFYWDMGNDVPTAHRYSLPKACNYALSANVDTLITEVEVRHPVGIESLRSDERSTIPEGVYTLSGIRVDGQSPLPPSVYILRKDKKVTKRIVQ